MERDFGALRQAVAGRPWRLLATRYPKAANPEWRAETERVTESASRGGRIILRYQDREVKVPFTPEKHDWVLGIILDIRAAKGGGPVGRSHQIPQKCGGCSVGPSCGDLLLILRPS